MGEGGEALTRGGEMEEEMDKGKKEEAMDPIMMEEDHINKIMETTGKMHSGVPYQYKMNNKKRSISDIEGLASDEEEVEDLRFVEQIEEILHTTYERKTRGPRYLHHAEVVLHHSSRWKDMIPPLGYHSFGERHLRNLQSIYLSVRRSGK
jgi:hypothetical protein